MNIYVYSDESGVFDKVHNDIYVFGGIILLSKEEKEITARKYISAERAIRNNYSKDEELKACRISNKDKNKLYRSLNKNYKFGVVVKQSEVIEQIFKEKKSKQRYLDYVYKLAVKSYFVRMIKEKLINPCDVMNISFYVDEHTTATNGRYELQEALLNEFKLGTYSDNWKKFYPPIFSGIKTLTLKYCDSKTQTLIRAADIVSNNIYHKAITEHRLELVDDYINIIKQP